MSNLKADYLVFEKMFFFAPWVWNHANKCLEDICIFGGCLLVKCFAAMAKWAGKINMIILCTGGSKSL